MPYRNPDLERPVGDGAAALYAFCREQRPKWTIAFLAEEAGVSRAALAKYATGRFPLSLKHVERVAEVARVAPSVLMSPEQRRLFDALVELEQQQWDREQDAQS